MDMFRKLEMVDVLVQLGVGYHFENEVHVVLKRMQGVIDDLISQRPDDLHAISQLFRILRNSGFDVSVDVFKGFREEKGGFKSSLCLDHKGMLSLYEASFLGKVDEGTMDEAREFTTKHLRELLQPQALPDSDGRLKFRLISYALEHPIHWRMTRLHARWFIDAYGEMDGMNPRILELAKLDYNAVQNMYKKEVKQLSRWWEDLSPVSENNRSYFRIILMEYFFWSIGFLPEPKFRRSRAALTYGTSMISLFDDCYDVYGTQDELELFNQAVQRWDATLIKELPQSIQLIFLAMLNTINRLGYEVLRDKDVDVTPLLKVAAISDAYNKEAQWYYSGYTPSMEEYMNISWITSGGMPLTTFAFCTSEQITNDAVQNFQLSADGIRYISIISRMIDDLVSATPQIGDVTKAIQLLMSENGGFETMAREHMMQIVMEQWKLLNTYTIPEPLRVDTYGAFLLGMPRFIHMTYQYNDGYGIPNHQTIKRIQSLVEDPIPL